MKIIKMVPLSLPLQRAAQTLDRSADPATRVPSAFSHMFARELSRTRALNIDAARDLLARIPQDSADGRAYADGLREAIQITEADGIAAFDQVTPGPEDEPATQALAAWLDTIEARSPLLEPLAHALWSFQPAHWVEMTVADVQLLRAHVTDDAVAPVNTRPDNDDERDVAPESWIRWSDAELLLPGVGTWVRPFIQALYGDVPKPDPSAGWARAGRDVPEPSGPGS